ncbi:MAG: hypothetical protein EKK57_11075 [Proteobacteria bacterium]|nr:MAG: hypothetical protein EKK57_11075 [Pseudomonadota bacterium]
MTPNEMMQDMKDKRTDSAGIYIIYCVPANKAYIGQSKNIKRRWNAHRSMLKNQCCRNPYLQNIYNKYGLDSFIFAVLENCQERLDEREAFYLSMLDKECTINLAAISEVLPMPEETKKKISMAHLSNDNKRKISERMKGNTLTKGMKFPERAEKARQQMLGNTYSVGVKHTEETKKQMSERMKGNQINKGRTHSEETRRKMSEAHKRRREQWL